MKSTDKEIEEQQTTRNRLQTLTAILLFALIVFVAVDGYFNGWGFVRNLISLNRLELTDKLGKSWELLARKDFQLVKIKDARNVLSTDSLLSFDRPYRDAGFYRLYFRNSDSSSAKLQKMYQALLSVDTGQTIKHTVEDAERAYHNLQRILRFNRPMLRDTSPIVHHDLIKTVTKGDLDLESGDETASVLRKLVSSPQIIVGVGIGIVAAAGVDLLQGDAYVAISKENVFRLDSINVGSRVGFWEGTPIDILWVFGRQDTVGAKKQ